MIEDITASTKKLQIKPHGKGAWKTMLGKISPQQERMILSLLNGCQTHSIYNILHLGFGDPEDDSIDVKKWSSSVHRLQRRETVSDRGETSFELIRKFNVIYSDVIYEDEDIKRFTNGYQTKLRSEEWFEGSVFPNNFSGCQTYQRIDAMEMNLPDNSVDIIVAVGLFSKFVPSIWKNLDCVLSEIERVIKKSGMIILTLHSDYFEEFQKMVEQNTFSLTILDSSTDTIPEANRQGRRMLIQLHLI